MDRKIGVVGLGYVGLPLAVAFGKKFPVVGFDLKRERIESLRKGQDLTGEMSPEDLSQARVDFTCDPASLQRTDFIIVAVPTPIDAAKRPDLSPLESASQLIGANIRPGTIVVFESTVYPGVTEEFCAPIIEKKSGLKCGRDFKIGYSPERINPGDKEHTLERIVKVVSGMDPETLEVVAQVYGSVCAAGVYRAANIRTAEAAKVIENTQRDLNIALVNELSMIFQKIGLDTIEVLQAAGTKWNFLPFRPGLVGGHCIGVDPYYLTYRAELAGYHPQVILAGRRINDGMGKYVAEQTVKMLISHGVLVNEAKVTLLGLTFKENVPDIRNTRVVDILHELREYGVSVSVADPLADPHDTREEYGIDLVSMDDLAPADAVILAVPHRDFMKDGGKTLRKCLIPNNSFIMDVKGALKREDFPGVTVWRL